MSLELDSLPLLPKLLLFGLLKGLLSPSLSTGAASYAPNTHIKYEVQINLELCPPHVGPFFSGIVEAINDSVRSEDVN